MKTMHNLTLNHKNPSYIYEIKICMKWFYCQFWNEIVANNNTIQKNWEKSRSIYMTVNEGDCMFTHIIYYINLFYLFYLFIYLFIFILFI